MLGVRPFTVKMDLGKLRNWFIFLTSILPVASYSLWSQIRITPTSRISIGEASSRLFRFSSLSLWRCLLWMWHVTMWQNYNIWFKNFFTFPHEFHKYSQWQTKSRKWFSTLFQARRFLCFKLCMRDYTLIISHNWRGSGIHIEKWLILVQILQDYVVRLRRQIINGFTPYLTRSLSPYRPPTFVIPSPSLHHSSSYFPFNALYPSPSP